MAWEDRHDARRDRHGALLVGQRPGARTREEAMDAFRNAWDSYQLKMGIGRAGPAISWARNSLIASLPAR
jgi:hypothetical protein